MTCLQNLRSIGRGLVGFSIVCGIGKLRSSLGLNPGVIGVLMLF